MGYRNKKHKLQRTALPSRDSLEPEAGVEPEELRGVRAKTTPARSSSASDSNEALQLPHRESLRSLDQAIYLFSQ